MKAKLVAYSYLCINRSGSTRTDSLQVIQTQRLSDKHKRIPKEHNTDHQVRTTPHESTGSVDEISTTIINAKISNKTTNSFLTSNNDQDIHPDDQHG